jgi:hypothetical protein
VRIGAVAGGRDDEHVVRHAVVLDEDPPRLGSKPFRGQLAALSEPVSHVRHRPLGRSHRPPDPVELGGGLRATPEVEEGAVGAERDTALAQEVRELERELGGNDRVTEADPLAAVRHDVPERGRQRLPRPERDHEPEVVERDDLERPERAEPWNVEEPGEDVRRAVELGIGNRIGERDADRVPDRRLPVVAEHEHRCHLGVP